MAYQSGILQLFTGNQSGTAPNGCSGCSSCCQFCGEPPFTSWEEINNLPQAIRDELISYYDNIENNNINTRGSQNLPCMWLDQVSGLCTNYGNRPNLCRNFIIGSPECLYFRTRIFGG